MIKIKSGLSLSSLATLLSKEILNGTPFEEVEDWGVPTCLFQSILGIKIRISSQGNNVDYILDFVFEIDSDTSGDLSSFRNNMRAYLSELLKSKEIDNSFRILTVEEVRASMKTPKNSSEGKPIFPNRIIKKGGV